jgi:HK97 gp10 family phage protein
MTDGIQVEGLKQAVRSLERMGVEVADLKTAFKKVGNLVADDARQIVNSQTGALAGSVRTGNAKNKAIVRAGSAKVPYAGVINFGGYHNIQAQDFLGKAAEQNEKKSVTTIEEEIKSLISKLHLR